MVEMGKKKKPLKFIDNSVNEDLLEMVEGIVEKIKNGDITDVLFVCKGRGGELSTHRDIAAEHRLEFLGHLEWAKWCL